VTSGIIFDIFVSAIGNITTMSGMAPAEDSVTAVFGKKEC